MKQVRSFLPFEARVSSRHAGRTMLFYGHSQLFGSPKYTVAPLPMPVCIVAEPFHLRRGSPSGLR